MAYCTQADLVGRFGADELLQLTLGDQNPATAVIDSAVVALAILDAGGEIDGYLAARYTLPLAAPDANLTRIACDIARYRLYENEPSKAVTARYEAAIAYLAQVAAGAIEIGPGAPSAALAAVMTADPPVFGREAL